MIEWFEDLAVGMRFKSPERVVSREDIKRFAAEFDPQPFHLDEAAAKQTPLKGLAASGWHTAAIAMRLAVDMHPFGPQVQRRRLVVHVSPRPSDFGGSPIDRGFGQSEVATKPDLKGNYLPARTRLVTS